MATFYGNEQLVSVRRLLLQGNDSYTVPSGFYETFEVTYYNGTGVVSFNSNSLPIGSKIDNNIVFPRFTLVSGEKILCNGIGSTVENGLYLVVRRYKNP